MAIETIHVGMEYTRSMTVYINLIIIHFINTEVFWIEF